MPDPLLYPYPLAPRLVPAIWGGTALMSRYGKVGDPKALLGESWECFDTNVVSEGPLAGKSLAELRVELGAQLLGDLDATELFPLLTKLIDARGALSVQVHPDDAYAQRVEGQRNGKTECWVILHAEPAAEIVLGWKSATDRTEFERRVADGTLGGLLRHVPVKTGEVYYLPAGTLHAIGAGIVIFEAQQASDLTYRIFDWNRVDKNGKSRELHVTKAGDVLDFGPCTFQALQSQACEPGRTLLVAAPHFVVERLEAPMTLETDDRPIILMTLDQPTTLTCPGGTTHLAPYASALVPAAAGHVKLAGSGTVLCVTPPARSQAVAERLQAAGISPEAARTFLAQF